MPPKFRLIEVNLFEVSKEFRRHLYSPPFKEKRPLKNAENLK